jgi:GcrA cell cycle regulator
MFANTPTWTDERIEALKRGFEAGLSCRDIAAQIGVSRNAVIGKLSRLNLGRGKPVPLPKRAAAPAAKRGRPRLYSPPRLVGAPSAAPPPVAEIPNANCCSLLELSQDNCRWPLASAGVAQNFCGNPRADGLPYCPGHARLAYRAAPRRHSA